MADCVCLCQTLLLYMFLGQRKESKFNIELFHERGFKVIFSHLFGMFLAVVLTKTK